MPVPATQDHTSVDRCPFRRLQIRLSLPLKILQPRGWCPSTEARINAICTPLPRDRPGTDPANCRCCTCGEWLSASLQLSSSWTAGSQNCRQEPSPRRGIDCYQGLHRGHLSACIAWNSISHCSLVSPADTASTWLSFLPSLHLCLFTFIFPFDFHSQSDAKTLCLTGLLATPSPSTLAPNFVDSIPREALNCQHGSVRLAKERPPLS